MDDFELELKMGFLEEATQLLADTEQCFLDLEGSPDDPKILEKIFRLAHNLKGSAKAVGFDNLGEFTHELETFLLKLKNKVLPVTSSVVSLLLRCNDHISQTLNTLKQDPNYKADNVELLADILLHQQSAGDAPVEVTAAAPDTTSPDAVPTDASPPTAGDFSETYIPDAETPVTTALAEATHQAVGHFLEPEPLIAPPAAAIPPTASSPTPPSAAAPPTVNTVDESIRVSLARLEKLLNYVGEMVILQTVLKEQAQGQIPELLRKTVGQLGKVTKEVQDISMSLRMIPMKQTFQKMQRIVRDTSSQLNKKINLTLEGEETEVDKTVLEKLSDPLVHLVRNAVDHGVESAAIRVANGKPETGHVTLRALHQSGSLVIEVRDDGGGLNADKLTAKAIEKGILKPGTVLSPSDAYLLIFAPGFSTKTEVTNVSGRGVGMDVVKTNIERLQGEVSIETVLGKGTTFRIRLPLTLAIIDGMIIQSEKDRYVIPLNHVRESVRPAEGEVQSKTGLGEILLLRGEPIPLFRLTHLLQKRNAPARSYKESIAIVIHTLQQPIAVLVDDIIGQHQVVVKNLGLEHKDLRGFSGSAILGDGRPSLILELGELFQRSQSTVPRSTPDHRRAA